jgi:hypothetical protein
MQIYEDIADYTYGRDAPEEKVMWKGVPAN